MVSNNTGNLGQPQWFKVVPNKNLTNITETFSSNDKPSETQTDSPSTVSIPTPAPSTETITSSGQVSYTFKGTKSERQQHLLCELKDIYQRSKSNEKVNLFVQLIRTIYRLFLSFAKNTIFYYLSEDYNRTLTIQEHLTNKGSYNFIHKNLFLDLIKDKSGAEFDQLRSGLNRMRTSESSLVLGLSQTARHMLAKEQLGEFQKLKPGEDMWMDLSSRPGGHSMKGRISCEMDGTYIFHLSNSGAGLGENEDFHPKARSHSGKPVYQIVSRSVPLSKENFSLEFFKEMMEATLKGKYPEGHSEFTTEEEQKKAANGELLQPIGAIYAVARKYGMANQQIAYSSESPLWSRAQFKSSCVPNSYWKMAKTVLTDAQYKELRLDLRIRSLQKNYVKIVNDWDRSDTAKTMALDQVVKLMWGIDKKNKQTSEFKLYEKIHNDLIERGARLRADVKLENPQKLLNLSDIRHIKVREAALKRIGNFKAKVLFENITDSDGTVHTVEIRREENGNPKGILSNAYLLYEAIVSEDDKTIDLTLKNLVKIFSPGNSDPESILIRPQDFNDLNIITALLINLANKLNDIDSTKSGILKQHIIANIAKDLFLILAAKKGNAIWDKDFLELGNYIFKVNDHLLAQSESNAVKALASSENLWSKYLRSFKLNTLFRRWNLAEEKAIAILNKSNLKPNLPPAP